MPYPMTYANNEIFDFMEHSEAVAMGLDDSELTTILHTYSVCNSKEAFLLVRLQAMALPKGQLLHSVHEDRALLLHAYLLLLE